MDHIDTLTECEAKKLLHAISDKFGIGADARTAGVILANADNVSRRSHCLSRIEAFHTVTREDDDGEPMEEELLNWGEDPAQYIETYKAILTPNAADFGWANANLIAAAPDLLAALEKMLDLYSAFDGPVGPTVIMARAAIEKAKPEPHNAVVSGPAKAD